MEPLQPQPQQQQFTAQPQGGGPQQQAPLVAMVPVPMAQPMPNANYEGGMMASASSSANSAAGGVSQSQNLVPLSVGATSFTTPNLSVNGSVHTLGGSQGGVGAGASGSGSQFAQPMMAQLQPLQPGQQLGVGTAPPPGGMMMVSQPMPTMLAPAVPTYLPTATSPHAAAGGQQQIVFIAPQPQMYSPGNSGNQPQPGGAPQMAPLQVSPSPTPSAGGQQPQLVLVPLSDIANIARQVDTSRYSQIFMNGVCKEHLSSGCRHGAQCHYLHLPVTVRPFAEQLCRDFNRPQSTGGCQRPLCRFYHGTEDMFNQAMSNIQSCGLNTKAIFVRAVPKGSPMLPAAVQPQDLFILFGDTTLLSSSVFSRSH